ncbi:MAG: hypothetical protein ACK41T_03880 [Pseudobdellovibrio sp.]
MKHKFKAVLFLVFLYSANSFATDPSNIFYVCDRQKEVRVIRVFTSSDGKCKTSYSKEGYTQVVSSASFFASCEAVLQNVKKNIEEGGFKCREEKLASVVEIE